MDVGDGADQLCEYLLDLVDGQRPVFEEVVVKLIACGMSGVSRVSHRWGVCVLAVLPEQYSNTSQTSDSVTMTSYSRAMCGCTNWRWWCISRARFESSLCADLRTTWDGRSAEGTRTRPWGIRGRPLTRTLEPLVSLCEARYTLPKEPFPIKRPRV